MTDLCLTTIAILAGGVGIAAYWLGYFNLLTFLGCALAGFGCSYALVNVVQAVKARRKVVKPAPRLPRRSAKHALAYMSE